MNEVLYKKEIEQIKDSGYLSKELNITDALIQNFFKEILKENERKMLEIAFSKNPKQEDLNELLRIWDIEVKGGAKSLMLAYIMKLHPTMEFSNYEQPRLKGLLAHTRFKNLGTITHFGRVGKALNKGGIEPMILKGGAMKVLRPELPRIMGDIDILVDEKDYLKSVEIALPLGYYYEKFDIHSVDLHDEKTKENALDVHKFLYFNYKHDKKITKEFFKRARQIEAFGVKCLIPSHEDMLFIALMNLARNLRDNTSKAGLLYALFDCKFLIDDKKDFNWEIVRQNAKKINAQVQLNFAMKFIEKISKNILPEEILNNKLFEKETNNYSNMVMYNRFYLEELREENRALKFATIFKDFSAFKRYIQIKPKYFLLKLLRKHPVLIELFIKDLKSKKYRFEE